MNSIVSEDNRRQNQWTWKQTYIITQFEQKALDKKINKPKQKYRPTGTCETKNKDNV